MIRIELIPVEGIPEVRPGDVLAELIAAAAELATGDIVVVTQKIVSKAEGRLVPVDPDDPLSHKQTVLDESVRVIRRRGDLLMTETTHGFVCANAGVDLSNVERGWAALLPVDPDRSARRSSISGARRTHSGASFTSPRSASPMSWRPPRSSSWERPRRYRWRSSGG